MRREHDPGKPDHGECADWDPQQLGDGNRVEANNIWGTTGAASYGIWTTNTTDNFILKNTSVGHTNNFDLSANDTYGPVVTSSGALSSTGDASHPWANFSR